MDDETDKMGGGGGGGEEGHTMPHIFEVEINLQINKTKKKYLIGETEKRFKDEYLFCSE